MGSLSARDNKPATRSRQNLRDRRRGSSDLSPEAQAVLADWVASGDYDRIVAEITANDPDIATQR